MFLVKLKGEEGLFGIGKHILILSLTFWGNVNYYKSVYHHIPTRENRDFLAIFKINQ